MKREETASKLKPVSGAFYLALVISIGFLSIQNSSAAGRDDHSYLPPWMLNEAGEVRGADEKAAPPSTPLAEGVQPVKAEVLPVKTDVPSSTGLSAKATLARAKVVGFVSGLFRRSVRFATGE